MKQPAIYLDHNASTPLLPDARAALLETLELTGNPSSVHAHGRALRQRIEDARDQVAALAGAQPKSVVFTSSATEAITQAIVGGVRALGAKRVVVSAGEHKAALSAAEASGVPVTVIGLEPTGTIAIAELALALEAADAAGERLLVAVHAVNNETGVVQKLAAIEALVGPTRHWLFVDAAQSFGKLPLEFSRRRPDMVAVSAHKIGGPAGAGALLVKSDADAVRLIPGGGQEQGRRGGTEAAALIAGFGAAADVFPSRFEAARLGELAQTVEAGLKDIAADIVVFGAGANRLGNVVNFAVPGLRNSVAMMALDLAGVSISSGSACSSGKVSASHVLAAMRVPPELSECALRLSLGWSSSAADVDAFLRAFGEIVVRHRGRQKSAA